MPPSAVKSVRDTIFWQYAKIIASSSGFGKTNYRFVMSTYKKLQSGEMVWSSAVHEWLREMENPNVCIYCGCTENLTTEHILPRHCGGEDVPENVIRVCKSCNSSKGGKRLYEWKGLKYKDKYHGIAEAKYLKYLYSLHERQGTLDCETVSELCKKCNMHACCEKEKKVGKLTVYCIEGCFHK